MSIEVTKGLGVSITAIPIDSLVVIKSISSALASVSPTGISVTKALVVAVISDAPFSIVSCPCSIPLKIKPCFLC